MEIKLAEALLRRKELQGQVDRLRPLNQRELYEVRVERRNVSESIDDIAVKVPKISMQQVTHAFDWHAKQLRKIDAAIQQANWTANVAVDQEVMTDYIDPYVKE